MAPRTLVVLWRITERCDLACPFCAYDRSLARARRSVSAGSVLAFGEVLGSYARETSGRVLVSWLGGEPLTWPPLPHVSQALCEQHDLALSLTTNGTRLHQPRMRALLLAHYAELTISVDGLGHVHDALRGRDGLFEHLARAVRQLADEKCMSGRGPLLRANVVIMRRNVAEFANLCGALADWGIEEITFNQLGSNDRPEFFPENRLSPVQVDQLALELPLLRTTLAQRGVTLRGDDAYLGRIRASSTGLRLSPDDCAPGRQFLFIDEQCRVAPCGFTAMEYAVPLSQITTVDDIIGLPVHYAKARRSARAPACADCHSTQHHGKFAVATP